MFSPIQIKHECTNVEDVNASSRINASDSSAYPIFINQDAEYKHRQLSQFWEQTQLPNNMPAKNEIHDQQTMFQVEVSNCICNYVSTLHLLYLILYISILGRWELTICEGLSTEWYILSS